jgi:AcrR family transcriptional regulator
VGRPSGSKNPGYEERRDALARSILPRLTADDGPRTSLADLAAAANVSVPTMKHYFGDRSGVVAAGLRILSAQGAPWTASITTPSSPELAASLTDVATALATAWVRFGVGRVFGAAIAVGIHDATVGPGTVDGVLEPTIQAIETRLGHHASAGTLHLGDDELRLASLQFLSPLLLALLHQNELSGAGCRPLDMDQFIARHVARFVRAWT